MASKKSKVTLERPRDTGIAQTQRWVDEVVLRNNFCPFAHKPARDGTIRYVSSQAKDEQSLADDIISELMFLKEADKAVTETTMIVAPFVLAAFSDYNQFLDVVDTIIDELELDGFFQVASFHPQYQFADLGPDDVRNYTNRSPYPMFHIIREESVALVRATYPGVAEIPTQNMACLEKLGLAQAESTLAACRNIADLPGEA